MKRLREIDCVVAGDVGTQAASVILVDTDGQVLARGSHGIEMVSGLSDGCKEQRPMDWLTALQGASQAAVRDLGRRGMKIGRVLGVGLDGQMHGEVGSDSAGAVWPTARLWCDGRNTEAGAELTELFGVKVPTRMTVARWLWTVRNQPDKAEALATLTTPVGWVTRQLCGENKLGVGEASGMFPIGQDGGYDRAMAAKFNALVAETDTSARPILELLPMPVQAGEVIGYVSKQGAKLLGIAEAEGAPLCPPEGDQPAALVGAFVAEPGTIGASWGTSVCLNVVGDRPFQGVHPAVDCFCSANGHPVHMVWVKNGTTFYNLVVKLLRLARGDRTIGKTFGKIIPMALADLQQHGLDTRGLFCIPLLETEPCTGFVEACVPAIVGMRAGTAGQAGNLTPGNLAKAVFLGPILNARIGLEELRRQGNAPTELVLTGGVLETPESTAFAAQLIADGLTISVRVHKAESAREGSAYGAALLMLYALRQDEEQSLADFLQARLGGQTGTLYRPSPGSAEVSARMFRQHLALLEKGGPGLIAALAP